MTDWIWINGQTLPMSDARIGVEDRGFQFADGVYEVIRLYNGRPFTLNEHLARLEQSCAGINLPAPMPRETLAAEIQKLIARTGVKGGMVYLQVTRGAAPRNHVFPDGAKPTVLFYVRPLPPLPDPGQGAGAKLLAVPDERWKRCWIKSIALLPNVLAKNAAAAKGADEAVFIDDGGDITECAASNIFLVLAGRVLTHPVGPKVLPGITRAVLLECAKELKITVEQRAPGERELYTAQEVFITSTTREITFVTSVSSTPVGSSRCGPVTLRLHEALRARVHSETSAGDGNDGIDKSAGGSTPRPATRRRAARAAAR